MLLEEMVNDSATDLEKKADGRLVKAKGKKPKRASAGAEDGVPAKKKKKKKVSVD